MSVTGFDPVASLAELRHEFGEHGGVNMSVEASTTFTVMQAETMPEIFHGRRGPDREGRGCYLYGRHFNPTVHHLGRQIASIEGAEAGYCAASGMAAISSVLLQICAHGDEIVAADALYGGTFALLRDYLPTRCGIRTTFVPVTDEGAIRKAITQRTRLIYVESLSNPTLRLADIPRLAGLAREHGIRLVVDNTFTPMTLSPIPLGADVVVHSLTKFINGASDIVAGAVCGSTDFVASLMDLHFGSFMLLGPTMDPEVAFRISLRVPHLAIRVAEHSRRAMEFAARLDERGLSVTYPGLRSHPDHDRFTALANGGFGYGGIFGVDVGTRSRAEALMEHLQNKDRFGFMAVSLGFFDTLMSCSASSTSSELSDEELRRAGIAPGYIRFSIGYTGTLEQRWTQFERALDSIGA